MPQRNTAASRHVSLAAAAALVAEPSLESIASDGAA